jgi:sulfate adenylyltransferase
LPLFAFVVNNLQLLSVLDGDHVRKLLSSELGFSKEHRVLNVHRIGYVASEIVKPGGIAIAALIAPYRAARAYARELVHHSGGFIEIYLNTPLNVCESRDRKGLYKKARQVCLLFFLFFLSCVCVL